MSSADYYEARRKRAYKPRNILREHYDAAPSVDSVGLLMGDIIALCEEDNVSFNNALIKAFDLQPVREE